jgi:putative CocE/NonD family hydrolase
MPASVVLGDGPLGEDAAFEKDVMVRMSDGVRIACDVFRPKAPGKYPVLFASSPYIKDSVDLPSTSMYRYRETGNIAKWVSRGYAYVHADVRGSGKSEGTYDVWGPKEQSDYCEMIEWAGTQSWSNGKVGMIGESYYGMNQWQAAQHNPPHLACIAPYDAGADIYRHFVYKGGILAMGFLNHWYNNSVRYRHFLDYPDRPKREDYFDFDFLRELALHPSFDDYWKVRRADLKAIKVPAFTIGNWEGHGVHLLGNLQGFMQGSGPRKLMVTTGDAQKLFLEPVVEDALVRWYDHWLKGIDNGVMKEPPVRIFVRGGEGWRDEQEWPIKRARTRTLYLTPGKSGAVDSLNDGVLAWDKPTADKASTSYVSPDPGWSIPGIGTNVMGRMGLPHTTRRIVTFTSAPLTQDMEVTGPVLFKLFASTTANDAQFIVKIMDMGPVSPDVAGALKTLDVAVPARMVTMGWLKASHRALDPERSTPLAPYHSHENPQPLEPGKVYEFDIEIWPTCWLFKTGHRIRVDITSFDLGHHIGHLRGTDTFHHDASRPSHLVLPVVAR